MNFSRFPYLNLEYRGLLYGTEELIVHFFNNFPSMTFSFILRQRVKSSIHYSPQKQDFTPVAKIMVMIQFSSYRYYISA